MRTKKAKVKRQNYKAKFKTFNFLLVLLTFSFLLLPSLVCFAAEPFLIDNFEKEGNLVGGKSNTYEKEPSKALAMRLTEQHFGEAGRALMIKYDKKVEGGLYGIGGWCGYYTMLRSGGKYFDLTGYKAITFMVKGEKAGENFKIGIADKHWEELGDSIKSDQIIKYIPSGKITTDWQKATVPLDVFYLDKKEIASVAICFENDCFPAGAAKGTVYIDDLKLE